MMHDSSLLFMYIPVILMDVSLFGKVLNVKSSSGITYVFQFGVAGEMCCFLLCLVTFKAAVVTVVVVY